MLEVKPLDDIIKKYNLDTNEEYDQIPLTEIYIMDFGFMTIIDNYKGKSAPLNRKYAIISDDALTFGTNLLNEIEDKYVYKDGELVEKRAE